MGIFGYGNVALFDQAQAACGTFIANAGQLPGANGGVIYFYNSASADQATFTANGGTGGALGGRIIFYIDSTANEATLVANGSDGNGTGATGGGIELRDGSAGDTAKVQLYGDGYLDLQLPDTSGLTIGSLEGNGLVILGDSNLSVGSDSSSTLFSGIIQDGAGVTDSSLTKVGPGTLALTGANTYNGPTVIQGGRWSSIQVRFGNRQWASHDRGRRARRPRSDRRHSHGRDWLWCRRYSGSEQIRGQASTPDRAEQSHLQFRRNLPDPP